MRTEKVKLTKFVSVNLPVLPNFIVHEDGKHHEVVPVRMFTNAELKKIGRAWTNALVKSATKKRKT